MQPHTLSLYDFFDGREKVHEMYAHERTDDMVIKRKNVPPAPTLLLLPSHTVHIHLKLQGLLEALTIPNSVLVRTRTSVGVLPPAVAFFFFFLSLSLINSPTSSVTNRRFVSSNIESRAASRFSTLNPCTTAAFAIEWLDEPRTPTRAAAGTHNITLAPRRMPREEEGMDSLGDPTALRLRKSGRVACRIESGDNARVINS